MTSAGCAISYFKHYYILPSIHAGYTHKHAHVHQNCHLESTACTIKKAVLITTLVNCSLLFSQPQIGRSMDFRKCAAKLEACWTLKWHAGTIPLSLSRSQRTIYFNIFWNKSLEMSRYSPNCFHSWLIFTVRYISFILLMMTKMVFYFY